MIVHKHPCLKPNVGDELNDWFWKEVLSESVLAARKTELLVGIGTLLNDQLPPASHYHVLGSGTGYGSDLDIRQDNITVHFVRGPKTAKRLGLDSSLAITDPGILVSKFRPQRQKQKIKVSFMPHVGIDARTDYRSVIEPLGWNYISPSDSEDSILSDIANSEVLITSAMHGAILADCYRVPWVPIVTSNEILSFKWEDWCESMDMSFVPHVVPDYWPQKKSSFITKCKQGLKRKLIRRELLRVAVQASPCLSDDKVFKEKSEQVVAAIAAFDQLIQTGNP